MRYLALYGLVLAGFNIFWTLSVALNGAAVATVLVYCSAAFTAILGWWILKERLDWTHLLAIAACLGGCALVSGALAPAAWETNLAGIGTGLLSGLAYAAYSLMGRSAAQRGLSPWTTLLYTFSFAALYLGVINFLPQPASWGAPGQRVLLVGQRLGRVGVLFLLAAFPTVAGFGLYNVSLAISPPVSPTSSSQPSQPSPHFLPTCFSRTPEPSSDPGSLLILGGVVFLRVIEAHPIRARRKAAAEFPSEGTASSTARSSGWVSAGPQVLSVVHAYPVPYF